MHSKAEMTREEEAMIQYCRDRLDLYIMLEKKYGHEKACKILSLYDLERSEKLRLVERRRGSVGVSEAPTGHFIHLPFRFPQPHKQGDGKTDEAKGESFGGVSPPSPKRRAEREEERSDGNG